MKVVYRLMAFLTAVAWIGILGITSIDMIAYHEPGFYEKEYRKYEVKEDVNMDLKDILYVTDEMMAYLKGHREDLVVNTIVAGEEREFFNDREKAHMKDVQDLFLGAIKIRRYLLMFVVFCTGTLLFMEEKVWKRLSAAFLAAFGIMATALGALVFYMSKDFTKGFTQFHLIFFDNDLWLLDPKTDLLINILPEGFFVDIAIHIAVCFAVMLIFFAIVSIAVLINGHMKHKKNNE